MNSRRHFLKTAAGAAAAVTLPTAAASGASPAAARKATDWVTLGNSGVKVTRLAFGTGTFGGRVQRELGQDKFNRLVRHAYDSGIRFFETADNYAGMHEMLAVALKGIPRDSYRLMTKFRLRETESVPATLDRFRRETNSEYFDIVLLHCVRTHDWSKEFAAFRDGLSEAKHRKVLLAHGASAHGLLPVRTFTGNQWLDVALMRINHDGARMDRLERNDTAEKGNVAEVTQHASQIHRQGTGVLGMKIIGEGQFTTPEQREASIRYVMGLGTVDAVTIGYKSPAEIDEAIARINSALKS